MKIDECQEWKQNYDFIEESCGYSEPLDFIETPETTIVESESTGSKFKVLGVSRGVFQPCGEFSRNNRLYESTHWNKVLGRPEIQNKIKMRGMLGQIGHVDRPVTDLDVLEGKVSHIVTVLEVRENAEGKPYLYGELEILDTPAGRNLKAIYEAGANIYVSSRGAGKLLDVPGQTYKLVSSDNFFLETFDAVLKPGFLQARPVFEGVKESEEVSEAKVETGRETYTDPEGHTHTFVKSVDKDKKNMYGVDHEIDGKPVGASRSDLEADINGDIKHDKKAYGIKEDEVIPEENISEVSDYLVRKVSDKRKIEDKKAAEKLDRAQAFANSKYIVGDSAERAKAYEKEAKAEKAETAEKKANNEKLVAQREARRANESDEISSLKAQVERLAKIVEKVVDDCYEEPVEEDATDKKLEDLENMSLAKKSAEKLNKETKIVKESIDEFFHLMSETNISDEAMQEIMDMIFNNGENN